MKKTDKKEQIKTTPKGVWEATHSDVPKNKKGNSGEDMQKNGYPSKNNK